jgi:AraC-like DNA-binding protein
MIQIDTYSVEQWQGMARDSSYRVANLAKMLKVSRGQLQRLTQRLFRRSPQCWLDQQRMIVAALYLKEGRPTKAAASDLGFKQRSHFCWQFKHHYGLAPKAYLANLG